MRIAELAKLSGHGICGFINIETGMKYIIYTENMASFLLRSITELANGTHKNKLLTQDIEKLEFKIFEIPKYRNHTLGNYKIYLLSKLETMMYNKPKSYDFKIDLRPDHYNICIDIDLVNRKYKRINVKSFKNIIECDEYLKSIDYDILTLLEESLSV